MDARHIVIGAGPNGLAAAFYLAKAGLKPLVLERRAIVGGGATTEEFAPGYRCPGLGHAVAPLPHGLAQDMALARRGVRFAATGTRLIALSPDGRTLSLSNDAAETCATIRRYSDEDARRYPEFCQALARLGAFISPLLDATPPSLDDAGAGELWNLVKTARRFRRLARADAFRLLRWLPMAAADLVAEWFSTDLLQAAIAARGIAGVAMGPWSAGTGAILVLNSALDPLPGGAMTRGGPGVLTTAMAEAAREAGAEIRTESRVARIVVREGRASAVLLDNETELPARAVISSADPRQTLLDMVDPVDLDPAFRRKIRNYRCRGVVAKANLALSSLPSFRGVANGADPGARIHIGPTIDYLERAFDASKYGRISPEPYLDVAIPSIDDPTLAPAGHHVMSIQVQYAPFELTDGRDWRSERAALGRIVLDTLDRYAPGIQDLVVQAQIVTPLDLAQTYGLSGGDVLHGEPSLDQLFAMRPVLGCAQYRTPIHNLFLCGSGTHPGAAVTGGPGRNAAREIVRALARQA